MSSREYELCSETCPGGCPGPPNDSASYRKLWSGEKPQPDASGRVAYGCGKTRPPPLRYRLAAFLRALYVWAVRDRFQHVPAAEFRRRLAVCRACPEFAERPLHAPHRSWLDRLLRLVMREEDVARSCGKCGCRGLKLRLLAESCPLGKWQSLDVAEATKTSGG